MKGTIVCPLSTLPLVSVPAPGGTLSLKNDTCLWTGLQIAGQAVTQSLMLAAGTESGAGATIAWTAHGYELGILANGDQYQGEWEEKGTAKGSSIAWKLSTACRRTSSPAR
jgi:hypothetical protein